MHSIVTTFREAVIKVEIANFGAAMDTLIDQDATQRDSTQVMPPTMKYGKEQMQFIVV